MTNSLRARLLEKLEFDNELFSATWQKENKVDIFHDGLVEGAHWEHERTKALILALVDCVEALDHFEYTHHTHEAHCHAFETTQVQDCNCEVSLVKRTLAAVEAQLGDLPHVQDKSEIPRPRGKANTLAKPADELQTSIQKAKDFIKNGFK